MISSQVFNLLHLWLMLAAVRRKWFTFNHKSLVPAGPLLNDRAALIDDGGIHAAHDGPDFTFVKVLQQVILQNRSLNPSQRPEGGEVDETVVTFEGIITVDLWAFASTLRVVSIYFEMCSEVWVSDGRVFSRSRLNLKGTPPALLHFTFLTAFLWNHRVDQWVQTPGLCNDRPLLASFLVLTLSWAKRKTPGSRSVLTTYT